MRSKGEVRILNAFREWAKVPAKFREYIAAEMRIGAADASINKNEDKESAFRKAEDLLHCVGEWDVLVALEKDDEDAA